MRNYKLRIAELRLNYRRAHQAEAKSEISNLKSENLTCIILLEIWFGWVLELAAISASSLLMAMESSIFPVPSEIVIPPAAFLAAQGDLNFAGVIVGGNVRLIPRRRDHLLGVALARSAGDSAFRQIFFHYRSEKLERAEVWLAALRSGRRFLRPIAPGHSPSHFVSRPALSG